MNIIVITKNSFNTVQYSGVKNIAYASGIYSVTLADNTVIQYSADTYRITILW